MSEPSTEEIFMRFSNELLAKFGLKAENGITKIGLHPELFDAVVMDLYSRPDPYGVNRHFLSSFRPSDIGEGLKLNCLTIVPKMPEEF